jgi:hypothetical protein
VSRRLTADDWLELLGKNPNQQRLGNDSGALVRAWIIGAPRGFRAGRANEFSTDGTSFFVGRECIATRAPTPPTEPPIALMNAVRYWTFSPRAEARLALGRAFRRYGIASYLEYPVFGSRRPTEPDALVQGWYAWAHVKLARDDGDIVRVPRHRKTDGAMPRRAMGVALDFPRPPVRQRDDRA